MFKHCSNNESISHFANSETHISPGKGATRRIPGYPVKNKQLPEGQPHPQFDLFPA
jgi:hypothetical protein